MSLRPGEAPLNDGGLLITSNPAERRILAVGRYRELRHEGDFQEIDLGPVTVAPGLINAHTHLEISHLQGRTSGGRGFVAWLKSLVPHLNEPPTTTALRQALDELRDCGTVFTADMADRHAARLTAFLDEQAFPHWLMVQHFGFTTASAQIPLPPTAAEISHPELAQRADFCRAGHAFYSTRASTLQAAFKWCQKEYKPFALHLAESPAELEMLDRGRGEMADFFRETGILPPDFKPPGLSPISYAERLGLLSRHTLAIHCVHPVSDDIETLARRRVNVCLCPRSNAFIGVGRAPWEQFAAAGINLCLGSDSLTSNHDLNLWHELEFLCAFSPGTLDLESGLALLTRNAARALNLNRDYGSLEAGKIARWSIVPGNILNLFRRPVNIFP